MTVDDKVNVLLNIIQGLYFSQKDGYNEADYVRTPLGRTTMQGIDRTHDVHFARWRKPEPGDIVLCMTSPIDRWKVAYFVRSEGYSDALLREIGSDKLCHMGNESFVPIAGLTESAKWDRDKRWFANWASKAFHTVESRRHRWRGITFDGNHEHRATIFFNLAFDGMYHHYTSVPVAVPITWSRKTLQREVCQVLEIAGLNSQDLIFKCRQRYPLPHPWTPSQFGADLCSVCSGSAQHKYPVHDMTRSPAPVEADSTDVRAIEQAWAITPTTAAV